MPLSKLIFKPGVNRDQTDYASEGGWYQTQLVRFRSGFPEKFGGWTVTNQNSYLGSARSLFAWPTTDGASLISIGTNTAVYVGAGTTLHDITPIRATYTTSTTPDTDNCIGTTNASTTVTVTLAGHGATTGTLVAFSGIAGPTIGGISVTEMNKTVQITVIDANTFTFQATTAATSTTTAQGGTSITAIFYMNAGYSITTAGYGWSTGLYGGATSLTTVSLTNPFATTNGSRVITVTQASHGLSTGQWVFFASVASAVSGIPTDILTAAYQVTFLTSNTYTITIPSTTAAANATASGLGGAVTVDVPVAANRAWGSGSTVPVYNPARLIFFDKFNNDLVFNTQYDSVGDVAGDIYYWVYTSSFANRGELLSSVSGAVAVPQKVSKILFSPQGFLFAFGCTNYDALATPPNYLGTYDPLLIRWSNVDPDIGPEPEDWQPGTGKTAGFLRLQSGSYIVTAVNTRQETLVFTNTSLTSIQFLGTDEVFGAQELSNAISIIGPNVVIGSNNITYWMGRDRFYVYSGRVDTLPCSLRQYIFSDINYAQSSLFFAGVNNKFTEIIWFYCSAQSNEIDRYVVFNYLENIWYYGQLSRTAWVDSSTFNNPIGASNGWVYQHENGTDDGQPNGASPLPMNTFIQSADVDIDDGDKYMLIRRVIPDINFRGSETTNPVTGAPLTAQATITVGVRNFPGAANSTTNQEGQTTSDDIITTTATVDQYTNQVFIRARGRQMNFRIGSNDVGTQWQLGMPRVDARPDGMRN
jgi:hypothetical protein